MARILHATRTIRRNTSTSRLQEKIFCTHKTPTNSIGENTLRNDFYRATWWKASYPRSRLLQWWVGNIFSGVGSVCAGICDADGFVKEIRRYQVADIPAIIKVGSSLATDDRSMETSIFCDLLRCAVPVVGHSCTGTINWDMWADEKTWGYYCCQTFRYGTSIWTKSQELLLTLIKIDYSF